MKGVILRCNFWQTLLNMGASNMTVLCQQTHHRFRFKNSLALLNAILLNTHLSLTLTRFHSYSSSKRLLFSVFCFSSYHKTNVALVVALAHFDLQSNFILNHALKICLGQTHTHTHTQKNTTIRPHFFLRALFLSLSLSTFFSFSIPFFDASVSSYTHIHVPKSSTHFLTKALYCSSVLLRAKMLILY